MYKDTITVRSVYARDNTFTMVMSYKGILLLFFLRLATSYDSIILTVLVTVLTMCSKVIYVPSTTPTALNTVLWS